MLQSKVGKAYLIRFTCEDILQNYAKGFPFWQFHDLVEAFLFVFFGMSTTIFKIYINNCQPMY